MRALTIQDGALSVEEHPDPAPGAGQVLVAVKAAGLNGADMLQRKGDYPVPPDAPQDIPGLELAGEVVGLGEGAQRFSEGDRVMAVVGGGGQAELAVVHERGADARARGARLAAGRRGRRGVRDGPRRPLLPGRAAVRRAPAGARRGRGSGHGGGPAWPRSGRRGDRHRAQRGPPAAGRGARRHGDRPRGLRRPRPLRRRARARRRPEPQGQPRARWPPAAGSS